MLRHILPRVAKCKNENKRKKQFWRHSWRLLLGDLMILVSLIVILNVPCGLIRVNGDGLSPDLKDGDLVVVSKNDGVFMTNDVVLVSLEKCDLARVVASDDMVEVRDGKLFVNQEEVGQVNEQAKKEIVK